MILETKNDPGQVSVPLPGGIVGTDVQRFLEFAGKAGGELCKSSNIHRVYRLSRHMLILQQGISIDYDFDRVAVRSLWVERPLRLGPVGQGVT